MPTADLVTLLPREARMLTQGGRNYLTGATLGGEEKLGLASSYLVNFYIKSLVQVLNCIEEPVMQQGKRESCIVAKIASM